MEITIKVTDTKTDVPNCLNEVVQLLDTDKKRVDTLLSKGRKKIDLVGENCNLEIIVKD